MQLICFGLTHAGKSGGDKLKLKLKGGGVVDPDSGLEDRAHVVKSSDSLYSVVLGVVDIQNDRNSYYKLQVLEHDVKKKYALICFSALRSIAALLFVVSSYFLNQ